MSTTTSYSTDSILRTLRGTSAVLGLVALGGCTTVLDTQPRATFDDARRWVILPVQNYSGSPQAGERVEDMLAAMLPSRGLNTVQRYPSAAENTAALPELDERRRYEQSLDWARRSGSAFGIGGSLYEWRYKGNGNSEAAVGLSLQVVDVLSGKVLWSATAARSGGWGVETASGVAQTLIRDMLAKIEVKDGANGN